MAKTCQRTIIRLVFVVAFCVTATPARATAILDTGLVTFTPDGTQFGRLLRDANSSTWGSAKPFPGVTGAPAIRSYDLFAINSDIFSFIQISLDDPAAALFASAYLGAYTPVNVAPNFGLSTNYLGDAGLSQPFGNPSFFQISVAPFTTVLIPLNEVNPGGGAGARFNLLVEGFLSADYDDVPDWTPTPTPTAVPEPATSILFGSGVAVSALVRKVRQRRLRQRS